MREIITLKRETVDAFLRKREQDDISEQQKRIIQRHVERFYDWLPMDKELNPELLSQWEKELQERLTASSAAQYITHVNQLLRYAGHGELCPLHYRTSRLTGKRFGRLVALEPIAEKRGRSRSIVWRCRCDCGRTAEYSYVDLEYSHIMSCGCEQHPSVPLPLTYIEGTCVEMLENKKLRRDNTSGHTGVVLTKRGWVAKINFKGKLYYLGTYQDFALAVKARERAEEELHGSFLDWYYATYTDSKKVLADKTAPA